MIGIYDGTFQRKLIILVRREAEPLKIMICCVTSCKGWLLNVEDLLGKIDNGEIEGKPRWKREPDHVGGFNPRE